MRMNSVQNVRGTSKVKKLSYCLNVHEPRVQEVRRRKLNEDSTRNNSYDGRRYGTNVTTANVSPQGTISVEAACSGGGGRAA